MEKTLNSVFEQVYLDFEYIVIDGGSVDGSAELLNQHKSQFVYWISEPDNGIYQAMNKGVLKASGEYLIFLNSGDCFANPAVLETVFASTHEVDIMYGNLLWNSHGSTTIETFPDTVQFSHFYTLQFLPHQASFIRKSLFDKLGPYDENQRIISDWIFFLLATCKFNCTTKHLKYVISICTRDGISCDPVYIDSILESKREQLQKHFPAFLNDYQELVNLKDKVNMLQQLLGLRVHQKLQKVFGVFNRRISHANGKGK